MPAPWMNPAWSPPASVRATIVFVHGAVVNGTEMGLLRRRLGQLGYGVRQFHYRSMLRGLDENAALLREFIRETEGDVVHVVGHSMGGVLARQVFEDDPDPRPGRIIAIGSPLLDCWIGHRVSGLHDRGYCLLGKTVHDHLLRPRSPVWTGSRDFGVLAGIYPFGIGCLVGKMPLPSDGVVLLRETRLRGVRDHITFRLNHFGMLFSKRCCAQMAAFLACGAFIHHPPSSPSPVPATVSR
jgi:pimeloyl-ACP methyl ester carboxylesterase